MRKVLFILRSLPFPFDRDGLSVINYRLLSSLPESYEVDVISIDKETSEVIDHLKSAFPSIGNIFCFEDESLQANKQRFLKLCKNFLGANRQVYDQFLKQHQHKYDLIYFCVPPAPLYYNLSTNKTPVFLNAVDSFALLNKRFHSIERNIFSRIKYNLYKNLEKRMLKDANVVNFVSVVDAEYVSSLGVRNISVVPNGVDISKVTTNAMRRENELLFVGNFKNISNELSLDYFVQQIFPQLLLKYPQLKLTVVGPYLKKTYSHPNIFLKGFVEDVRDYYNRCTIFVSPLVSGSGIKNKVLEGMSCKCPVVSTSIGLDGIAYTNRVHAYRADTVEEWVKSIAVLMEDSSKRQALGEHAYNLVKEHYSWNNSMSRYVELFENLINR